MNKYLILASFLTASLAHAQIKNVSVHLGAGIPIIPKVEVKHNFAAIPIPAATGYSYTTHHVTLEESFSNRSAFEFGGRFDCQVSPRFYLTSGLSLHYARFHKNVRVTGITESFEFPINTINPTYPVVGQPFGMIYSSSVRNPDGSFVLDGEMSKLMASENLGKTTTLTIQLPVLIGTSFFGNKLQVRTGPVFGYLVASSEVKQRYSNATLSEYKDTSKTNFNEFQAGITCQTTYLIGKGIGIDLSAQKFLTNIYQSQDQADNKARYNVVSLGISYNFL